MKRLLITGATGDVGTGLCRSLAAAGYDLSTCALERPADWPYPFVQLDLADLPALTEAARGTEVMIHLAGNRNPNAPLTKLVAANIQGVQHAFEAAAQAGVQRVIYASSVHAGWNAGLDSPAPDDAVRPVSLYGATKVFGEAVARYYSDAHGLSCICLRLGWVVDADRAAARLAKPPLDPEMAKRIFLCADDLAQLTRLGVEAPPTLRFGLYNAVSDNREKLLDITRARTELGYAPTFDAFALLEAAKA